MERVKELDNMRLFICEDCSKVFSSIEIKSALGTNGMPMCINCSKSTVKDITEQTDSFSLQDHYMIIRLYQMREYEVDTLKRDYSIADTLNELYALLNMTTGNRKLKEATLRVDNYIKRGIGFDLERKNCKGYEDILYILDNYNMEKRRTAYPTYNTTLLDKHILLVQGYKEELLKGSSKTDTFVTKELDKVISYIKTIKSFFDDPHIIGLYEQSQFSTLSEEINWELKQLKKYIKDRQIFILDGFLNEVKETIKIINQTKKAN